MSALKIWQSVFQKMVMANLIPSITIAGQEISEVAPHPFVIAEVASAHEGDLDRALAITDAAVEAGADCVKYQIWSRGESFTADHPHYAVFGDIEFSREQWLRLMAHARSRGIAVGVDVDDAASMALALEGGADLLKLRTSNLDHRKLLGEVAASGKPIILATGASTLDEVTRGVETLRGAGAADIVLMHGFQAFPTASSDTHLRGLRPLRERYGHVVGYADHADGGSPLAVFLPAAALAFGACVIEKHISIDREKGTEDFESSLNGPAFRLMVEQLREVSLALGEVDHTLTEAERAYRSRFKKSLATRVPIPAGHVVTSEMIAFKVGGRSGIPIDQLDTVVGRQATAAIPQDVLIERGMLS